MDKRIRKSLAKTQAVFLMAQPGAWLSVRTVSEVLGKHSRNPALRRHLKWLVEMGVLEVREDFRGNHPNPTYKYRWTGHKFVFETGEVIDPLARRIRINGKIFEAA